MQNLPEYFKLEYIENIKKLTPKQLEEFLKKLEEDLKNITYPST